MATNSHSQHGMRALIEAANARARTAMRGGAVESYDLEPDELGPTATEQTLAIERLLAEVARDGLAIDIVAPKWKLTGWGLHDDRLQRLPGSVRARPEARGGWLSLRFAPIDTAAAGKAEAVRAFQASVRAICALAESMRDERNKTRLLRIVPQLEALADAVQRAPARNGTSDRSTRETIAV